MRPPMLRLAWEEELGGDPRQIVKVLDADGNVLGQLPVTSVKYEPQINDISLLTVAVIVQEASIESRRA